MKNAHPNKMSMAGGAGQGRVIFNPINSGDNLHESAAMDAFHIGIQAAATPSEPQSFAALQLRAALAGWVLTEAGAGIEARFVITRWGRGRELHDLAAVHQFLQRVEVRRG